MYYIRTVGEYEDICIGQTRNKCHRDIQAASQLASRNFSLAISLAQKMGYAPTKFTYEASKQLCQKCTQMRTQPCKGVLKYHVDTYQVDNTPTQDQFKM